MSIAVSERQTVGPADEDHAVDALREHLAVDEPEQRRPVEEHVVVVRLLDVVEEAVQGVAGEQLRRVGRPLPAGEDVQAAAALGSLALAGADA